MTLAYHLDWISAADWLQNRPAGTKLHLCKDALETIQKVAVCKMQAWTAYNESHKQVAEIIWNILVQT